VKEVSDYENYPVGGGKQMETQDLLTCVYAMVIKCNMRWRD